MPLRFFQWFAFFAVLSVLIAVTVALFLPGRGLLLPALSPRPETFTELYFEDHLKLPKDVTFNTPYQLKFVVHNLEGYNKNYQYIITVSDATRSSLVADLKKGNVNLSNNESKTISETITIPPFFTGRIKVSVQLDTNQEVYYWIEKPKTPFVSSASATVSPKNLQ